MAANVGPSKHTIRLEVAGWRGGEGREANCPSSSGWAFNLYQGGTLRAAATHLVEPRCAAHPLPSRGVPAHAHHHGIVIASRLTLSLLHARSKPTPKSLAHY